MGQNTPFSFHPEDDNPTGTRENNQNPSRGQKEFQRVIYICLWLLRYTMRCSPQELPGVIVKKLLLKEKKLFQRFMQLPALAQMEGNPPSNPFNTQAKHCEMRPHRRKEGQTEGVTAVNSEGILSQARLSTLNSCPKAVLHLIAPGSSATSLSRQLFLAPCARQAPDRAKFPLWPRMG